MSSTQTNLWLIDTGSPFDIIDESMIASEMHLADTSKCYGVQAAGGETATFGTIPMHVTALGETINVNIMQSSPNVLSLGRRIVEGGYSFHWVCGSSPFLTLPNGNSVEL